jgi:serine/threonine-protein kinase
MRPGSLILTQEGMVFGTPEFMSPEQAQGRTLDARSDIYSLAVILYEVLTGKLPFDAKTPMEYIQKHVVQPIIPLNERVPGLTFPEGLGAVIAHALAKKPEDRYQTAAEFAEALRAFGGTRAEAIGTALGSAPSLPIAGSGNPSRADPAALRPASRGPGTGLLIGVAAVCLLVGVVLAVVFMRLTGR